jgi:uncharacterized protein (DUF1810 family)
VLRYSSINEANLYLEYNLNTSLIEIIENLHRVSVKNIKKLFLTIQDILIFLITQKKHSKKRLTAMNKKYFLDFKDILPIIDSIIIVTI